MNRRDFLHPRRLARVAGQALAAAAEVRAPEPPPPDYALVQCARRAMATTFEVLLPVGTPDAVPAGQAALDEIDRLEDQLTVYRDGSEVSGINRLAATATVRVEASLFGLFTRAAELTAATAGAFDITLGALIKAWGFFRRRGRVPSADERAEVMRRVGMKHVVLDPAERSIHYRVAGLEINLGAIGKGYALDRVADLLRGGWGIASGLIHGGQSSVLALGSPPGDPRGWPVRIRHPGDLRRELGIVRLRDRALGTSGATFQHLQYRGRKLGHILDPRTGWPAEGMAGATVLAPTAADADALATAFFILGVEKACAYCAAHPEVGAVLLPAGPRARPVVLGLAPDEVSLADGAAVL